MYSGYNGYDGYNWYNGNSEYSGYHCTENKLGIKDSGFLQ